MAELRNCAKCGRVFSYQGNKLCRKCTESEDEDFAVVRRYVRDNPGADVIEVAEATRVKEEKILQFLREGRLISKGFSSSLKCERCGVRIDGGRYCSRCIKELNQEIKGVITPNKERIPITVLPHKDQMHSRKDGI